MFQVAACVSCHRLNGVGEAVGPDLAKLDPKMTPLDTVKSILDPSLKIDDMFRAVLFEMGTGQVVTGVNLDATADAGRVTGNPPRSRGPGSEAWNRSGRHPGAA